MSHPMRAPRAAPVAPAAVLAAVLAGAAPGEARAQGKTTLPDHIPSTNGAGMDTNLFRPAMDARGFFSVNGAEVLGPSHLSLGLVVDYGHGIMPLGPKHGADFMITHALKGVFQFSYGIANLLVVGVSLPVVIGEGGQATDIGPGATAGKGGKNADYDADALGSQALGDLALHLKIPILRPDAPIGIALLAQAGVGLGGTRNFASEPGFFYWPRLLLEKRIGRAVRLGLETGYRGHSGKDPTFGLGKDGAPQLARGVLRSGDLFTSALAVGVRPTARIELVAETYLAYLVGGPSALAQRPSAEALAGVKLSLGKSASLSAAVGPGYAPGFQTAQVRAMLGFVFEPELGPVPFEGAPPSAP